jgi:Co/Zn/Cd efflux system component
MDELGALRAGQASVLKTVLVVNAAMFLVEALSGLVAHSTALLADSLDMLGDALVYALTLYVINRGPIWRSRAVLVKGAAMAAFGIAVVVHAVARWVGRDLPQAGWMGGIGLLALMANVTCLVLLYRHRADDLNMRSTWLCSRNDVAANVGLLVAAGMVYVFNSKWPDLIVGGIIALLVLKSALSVLRSALAEWRRASTQGSS